MTSNLTKHIGRCSVQGLSGEPHMNQSFADHLMAMPAQPRALGDGISRAAIEAELDALKLRLAEKACADDSDATAAMTLGMVAAGVDAARAALRALTAQPVAQEPVAWRVRDNPGTEWRLLPGDPERMPMLRHWEKQPLYAHPATPAPVEAGLRDWFSDCRVLMANLDALISHTGEAPEDEDAYMVDEIRAALRAQSAPVGGEGG